jgi:hypothetical protein
LKNNDNTVMAEVWIKPLMAALTGTNPAVQMPAAEVLVKIGAPAVEPLAAMLADQDPDIQKAAADVLFKIGAPAVEPLTARLQRGPDGLRHQAAILLGKIGDERAVPFLVSALSDRDIRNSAAQALDCLHWQPATPSDRIYYLLAKEQKDLLLAEWEQVQKILIDGLLSGNKRSIESALHGLVELGGDKMIPKLIDILQSNGKGIIAQVYYDSGHRKLMDAAGRWADMHGYRLESDEETITDRHTPRREALPQGRTPAR